MKVIQITPVHAANLVANSGNTAYRVDIIVHHKNMQYIAVGPVSLQRPSFLVNRSPIFSL